MNLHVKNGSSEASDLPGHKSNFHLKVHMQIQMNPFIHIKVQQKVHQKFTRAGNLYNSFTSLDIAKSSLLVRGLILGSSSNAAQFGAGLGRGLFGMSSLWRLWAGTVAGL